MAWQFCNEPQPWGKGFCSLAKGMVDEFQKSGSAVATPAARQAESIPHPMRCVLSRVHRASTDGRLDHSVLGLYRAAHAGTGGLARMPPIRRIRTGHRNLLPPRSRSDE